MDGEDVDDGFIFVIEDVISSNKKGTGAAGGVNNFDVAQFFETPLSKGGDPVFLGGGIDLVKSDAAWKTLKEFLDYAKANPDMLTVGNSGAGGGVHLVALAFEKAAGVKFNHIPFAGGGPSVTALLGGHVNAVSVSPPEGVPHVQAGKLRIIGPGAKSSHYHEPLGSNRRRPHQ